MQQKAPNTPVDAPAKAPNTEPESLLTECPLKTLEDFKKFDKQFKSKTKRNQFVSNE